MNSTEGKQLIRKALENGKILTIPEMCRETGISQTTVRAYLNELVQDRMVIRCGYQKGAKLYRMAREEEQGGSSHRVLDEPPRPGGIWPSEIKAVKQWAVPGTTVRIWKQDALSKEENGRVVKTKIRAVYPHLVVLETGQSIIWAQLALYCRNKRGYIC